MLETSRISSHNKHFIAQGSHDDTMSENYLEACLPLKRTSKKLVFQFPIRGSFTNLSTRYKGPVIYMDFKLRSVQQNRVLRRIYLKTVYPDKVYRSI